MQFLTNLRGATSGSKTYLIAIIGLICLAAEVFFDLDVPGFDPGPDALEYLGGLLALITMRAGIAKAG